MSYTFKIHNTTTLQSTEEVEGIEEVREKAAAFVQERMEAFGDDTEALRQFGWYTSEAAALDFFEYGGAMTLPDGWRIEVIAH